MNDIGIASGGMTDGTLALRGSVSVTITETRSPKQFFEERKGLCVWSEFQNLVADEKAIDSGVKFQIDYFEITQEDGVTDAEIETTLKIKGIHLFEVNKLAAIIAEFISAQEGGKEGNLLNNGDANLFYTSSLVVHVYWDAGAGEWYVFSWRNGGNGWYHGYRVFVPGN